MKKYVMEMSFITDVGHHCTLVLGAINSSTKGSHPPKKCCFLMEFFQTGFAPPLFSDTFLKS